MTMTNDQLQKYLLAVVEGKIQACGNAGVITDKTARPCSPVARPLGRHVQYSVMRAVRRWS